MAAAVNEGQSGSVKVAEASGEDAALDAQFNFRVATPESAQAKLTPEEVEANQYAMSLIESFFNRH